MNSRIAAAATIVAACAALTSAAAHAAPPTKGEQVLKYRKSIYQVMAYNFGPLAAMSQGKMPYDAKEFSMRADRVAMIAPLLTEAYPPETRDVGGSKLKPEMWNNRADFDAKLKALVDKTAALSTAAKAGDFDESKAAFFEAGGACKSCHDKYRED